MSAMELTILGSSGSSPSRSSPASGYLVRDGETSLMLDAGAGTFAALSVHLDPGTLDGVVLSHAHVDHCVDIFALYGYMAYGPSGTVPIDVYAPEGLADHLSSLARDTQASLFQQVFEFHTVSSGDTAEVGHFGLTFFAMNHPVPTVGTRVEQGGRVLAYSADTGPSESLFQLGSGADLLLCEATHQGPAEERTYPHHLTAVEAGSVATEAGVRRLVVTHISSMLDEQRSLEEARSTFAGDVVWAEPGAVFEV